MTQVVCRYCLRTPLARRSSLLSVNELIIRRSSSAVEQARRPRRPTSSTLAQSNQRAGLAIFSAIVAGTFGLGSWQLARYVWKQDLIQTREKEMSLAPAPLPEATLMDDVLKQGSELKGRRVAVEGIFDHSREVLVGPRAPPIHAQPSGGGGMAQTNPMGNYVYTPLIRPDRSVVIVNRGWVSKGMKDWNRPTGIVTVTGVMREPEKRNTFSPPSTPGARQFQWADLEAIAESMGWRPNTSLTGASDGLPALLDVCDISQSDVNSMSSEINKSNSKSSQARRAPLVYPVPKGVEDVQGFYVMPSQHLMYAATWFSLAACGAAMTRMRFKKTAIGMVK